MLSDRLIKGDRLIQVQLYYHDETLILPPGKLLATLGYRAFASAAYNLWNSLSKEIRDFKSLSTFKSYIKTFLFICGLIYRYVVYILASKVHS